MGVMKMIEEAGLPDGRGGFGFDAERLDQESRGDGRQFLS
jgi:hypothetical protein